MNKVFTFFVPIRLPPHVHPPPRALRSRRCELYATERARGTELARIQGKTEGTFCEAGEGAVGRAMRDPRGFDLCANIHDLDDATLTTTTPDCFDVKNIVCCRVEGGVVELGTTNHLCSIHISGACPCAQYAGRHPGKQDRSLSVGDHRRHSPLSSSIITSQTHANNQLNQQLGDLLGLFDRWHGPASPPTTPTTLRGDGSGNGNRNWNVNGNGNGNGNRNGTVMNTSAVTTPPPPSAPRQPPRRVRSLSDIFRDLRGTQRGASTAEAGRGGSGSESWPRRGNSLASPAPAVQWDTSARRTRMRHSSFCDLRALHSNNGGGDDGDARGRGVGVGVGGGGGGRGDGVSSSGDRASSPPERRHSESEKLHMAGERFMVVAKFASVHHFIRDVNEVFGRVRWESPPAKPSPPVKPSPPIVVKDNARPAPRRKPPALDDMETGESRGFEHPEYSAVLPSDSRRLQDWSPQTSPRQMVAGC